VLRKVFGLKRDKAAGYWKRLANEELHDLSCIPNILGSNQEERDVWNMWQTQGRGGAYRVFVGKLSERCNLSDLGIDWRAILK